MVSYLQNIKTFNSIVHGPPLLYEIFKWIIKKPSVLSVSPSLVHVFTKSSSKLMIPDLEYVMSPASFKEGTVGLLDKVSGMTLGVWQTRPKSNGYVKINSKNIHEAPIINPNYLSDPYDVDVLLKSIKIGRNLLSTSPLQPYLNGLANPSHNIEKDDELLSWARSEGITVYHMIGTAKMGSKSDKLAVVNNELKVRGIECLRVADASIMPTMPSGNTNAPTMMIAEKASDMILNK
jgi:choline dehydrogenase